MYEKWLTMLDIPTSCESCRSSRRRVNTFGRGCCLIFTDFVCSAWMLNTELTPLDVESVTNPSEKGKSKVLLRAYEKAAEQNDLNHFKEMLIDHQKAIQEDQEAQAEREAKRTSKVKRKSTDVAAQAEDVDHMDLDQEASEAKPRSKKRKKEVDSEAGDEKVRSSSYIVRHSPLTMF